MTSLPHTTPPPKGNGLAVELAHAIVERVGGPVTPLPPVTAPDVAQLARERIARTIGHYDYNLTTARLFILASPALQRRLVDLADEVIHDLINHGMTIEVRR